MIQKSKKCLSIQFQIVSSGPISENNFVNEISFSYEKVGTKPRFEEEVKGNSEIA